MTLKKTTQRLAQQLFGAIAFYTTIPISARWTLDFTRIARWSPFVGLLIGALLAWTDILLRPVFPLLLRSAVVVVVWIALTGALHLDGAMDTADGLGVWDLQKRLTVMADSRSGAFGVIAAIAIVLLKVLALGSLSSQRSLALLWIPVWGRYAHVLAVGQYPYLKLEGKARLHHETFQKRWDYLPGFGLQLVFVVGISLIQGDQSWGWTAGAMIIAAVISWGTGYWFYRRLGGVTGDIHGAVVEWTETLLLLCSVAGLSR